MERKVNQSGGPDTVLGRQSHRPNGRNGSTVL